MMEALRSSETSVLTRATRRNIPEDGILLRSFMIATLSEQNYTLDMNQLYNQLIIGPGSVKPHAPIYDWISKELLQYPQLDL
jgi:hypothetical protein